MKKIKKIPKCFVVLTTFIMCVVITQAQYITLEGRQFKNGAQDFYPVVCNYNFMLTYNVATPGASDFYLSRINGYGPGDPSIGIFPNYDFECSNQATAYSELIADFTKIKSIGFNSIRVTGIGPVKVDTDSVSVPGFKTTAFRNIHPIWDGGNTIINYNSPYHTNTMTQTVLLPFIDLILQAADSCNLKVILITGGGDVTNTATDANDYASLLKEIANHLKNNTALLAYDLYNEPAYNQVPIYKEKVCEYTKLWYDTIKRSDPNHLITIGGVGTADAWNWDPAVMKIDFYSVHMYPYTRPYENYSPSDALERWKGIILWSRSNSPMPWIIGETGFSAYDDYYYMDSINYNPAQWAPHYVSPPLTMGDSVQQATFAQNSLDFVRNCGGSGYSWWNFQENWWTPNMEDGLGLFRHGNINNPGTKKPVVDVFDNYPDPPPAPQSWSYPNNYYDPDNWDHYCPPPCDGWYKKVHGTITESGTSNPISNAVLSAWVYYRNINDTINTYPNSGSTYTYSDDNGAYSINPQYPFSDGSIYNFIGITASGADAHWPGSSVPQAPWLYNDALNFYPFRYDLTVNNETVTAANSRNFQGWSTLTVNSLSGSSVTVDSNAVSEFTARDGVTINGIFTAALGSNVYIYCKSTFPECNDYSGFKSMHINNSVPDETQSENTENEKQMDVNFIPESKYSFLDIYPNPGNGIFTLNLRTNKEDNPIMQVNIFDITGSCVFKETMTNSFTNLDLSFLSKGIYYFHATTKDDSFNQKLIIK